MSTTLQHWERLINQMHLANRATYQHKWTDELDVQLGALIREGHTYREIEAIMSLPSDTARHRAADLGLREARKFPPARIFTQEEIALIEGATPAGTVARQLGLTRQRVHFLRETGLWAGRVKTKTPKSTGKRPASGAGTK